MALISILFCLNKSCIISKFSFSTAKCNGVFLFKLNNINYIKASIFQINDALTLIFGQDSKILTISILPFSIAIYKAVLKD